MASKSTCRQVEERCGVIADALARGATRGEVHRLCRERWSVSWKTADRYSGRARELLHKAIDKDRDTLRREAYLFYLGVVGDSAAKTADRLRARSLIDDLLGLQSPRRTELSGPDGGPIRREDSAVDARIDAAAEAMLRCTRQRAARAAQETLLTDIEQVLNGGLVEDSSVSVLVDRIERRLEARRIGGNGSHEQPAPTPTPLPTPAPAPAPAPPPPEPEVVPVEETSLLPEALQKELRRDIERRPARRYNTWI